MPFKNEAGEWGITVEGRDVLIREMDQEKLACFVEHMAGPSSSLPLWWDRCETTRKNLRVLLPPKPLTFGDLKIGEYFKYKGDTCQARL